MSTTLRGETGCPRGPAISSDRRRGVVGAAYQTGLLMLTGSEDGTALVWAIDYRWDPRDER